MVAGPAGHVLGTLAPGLAPVSLDPAAHRYTASLLATSPLAGTSEWLSSACAANSWGPVSGDLLVAFERCRLHRESLQGSGRWFANASPRWLLKGWGQLCEQPSSHSLTPGPQTGRCGVGGGGTAHPHGAGPASALFPTLARETGAAQGRSPGALCPGTQNCHSCQKGWHSPFPDVQPEATSCSFATGADAFPGANAVPPFLVSGPLRNGAACVQARLLGCVALGQIIPTREPPGVCLSRAVHTGVPPAQSLPGQPGPSWIPRVPPPH